MNSPAKAPEPGTASEITPTVMTSVARIGRPRAHAAEPREDAGRRAGLDHAREAGRVRSRPDRVDICSTDPVPASWPA